jgi:hypothetical protein
MRDIAMHMRLYKRREKGCEHEDDKNYMRCPCSVSMAWGKTWKFKERAQEV